MRVGIIGINHKLAHLELREKLAKACQRLFAIGGLNDGEHTFVLLTTCNRTEVYFTSKDLAFTHTYLLNMLRSEISHDFDQKVYSYFGHDCFLHLSRVASGLDSAVVAETKIQGQVKESYENAIKHISLPGELHYLFQKSLSIGKKVRTVLPMGRGMPDLEHAVYNTGKHFFKETEKSRILFVGASEINQKILVFLKSKQLTDITICNRSYEHAKNFACNYNTQILEWDNLHLWDNYDWIIFGTKSSHYLINRSNFTPNRRKLVIDLCVPRNVDPSIGKNPSVTLLNIDQINRILKVRKKQMTNVLLEAEKIVASSTQKQMDIFKNKTQFRVPSQGLCINNH